MSPASGPRRRGRWILLGLLLAFGIAQAMPVERTNPPVEWDVDAPAEVAAILRGACYDCHSHETRWPWYSRVAPVAWIVARHVEHGRGDLNFSQWPRLDLEAQEHAFHDIEEQISHRKMPLRSYTWMHPEARLTEAQRQALLTWCNP
ncbi:MAG TPA: heme-binding domain-containing protein [Candidatus Krumholzibacteria bacterium]|nr:heme-binding domain-containing protein [Candidatus Krumholzibacteria bacterium]